MSPQGAADTLLEFPCAAVLIDVGGETNAEFNSTTSLMDYPETFFNGRPDLNKTLHSLILTHPHKDHTLSVSAVLGKYRVLNAVTNGIETGSGPLGQIALHNKVVATEETADTSDDIGYMAGWQRDTPQGTGLTNDVIDPVTCNDVDPKITALWGQVGPELGWNQTQMKNGNNHSVVIRIDFGKASVLIPGDLEDTAIANLIAHNQGTRLLDVDVIQVSHHGSHNGTTDQLLRATTPDFAVIQMGPADRKLAWTAWAYGHPRKVAVDMLRRHVGKTRPATSVPVGTTVKTFIPMNLTRAIYGTGWDGVVILEADADGVWKSFDTELGPSLLNLNTATVEELIALPMIGPARASAIVRHRIQHGPFRSVDDLLKVPRSKSGTVNAVRNLVTTN
jgi:competence protein ComEC